MQTTTAPREAKAKPKIITENFNQKNAYDSFRATGFARGSEINALVEKGELTYPVRGDEFLIMSAPGKKLGAKVECDGQVYLVKDSELQNRKNVALVLSFSQLKMEGGNIEGSIVKVLEVPEKDGWYNVDAETAIPLAGKGSRSSDSTARYWYRREGEPYIGAVVRGDDWSGGDGRRVVDAYYWPDVACGVALKSEAQAEPKPEQLAKQLTEKAQGELAGLLRQANAVEKSVEALKATTKPELLEPMEAMVNTVRQLRIKE